MNTILLSLLLPLILFSFIITPVYSIEREYVDPDTLPYCKPGQLPGDDRFNPVVDENGVVKGFDMSKADVCKEKPIEFSGIIILLK